ncbi:MAG TPA: protein-L-isoaspartate(D-aspartate) O-methyltransferase [Hyphomonadaceae bacterium]|nr:protein-L-isoaspartate(D-aspartate) O-methyltransferase [Hyphomonadaceae bacterium]
MAQPSEIELRRENMVARQIAQRGVTNPALLQAMREVKRETFVPEDYRDMAFEDGPLPIGEDQTISQPYIVAVMADAAAIRPGDRILEVGTGSGYAAAVFAELAAHVYTIERHQRLAEKAEATLQSLGYANVSVRTGDGTRGWPEAAPFDAIIVAASGPRAPDSLKDQLAIGGRLVMPIGHGRPQALYKVTRQGREKFVEENLGPVQFVLLVGEEGWADVRG